MRKYKFHPLALDYPLMPDADLARMAADMATYGFSEDSPIVLFQDRILDGRNRYLAAEQAKVKALYVTIDCSYDEAAEFVRRRNEERRHLTDGWRKEQFRKVQEKRDERRQRIIAHRKLGKSIRWIAGLEKIAKTTTVRYIEKAQRDDPDLVFPETIQGTDGSTRTHTAKPRRAKEIAKPTTSNPIIWSRSAAPKDVAEQVAKMILGNDMPEAVMEELVKHREVAKLFYICEPRRK